MRIEAKVVELSDVERAELEKELKKWWRWYLGVTCVYLIALAFFFGWLNNHNPPIAPGMRSWIQFFAIVGIAIIPMPFRLKLQSVKFRLTGKY